MRQVLTGKPCGLRRGEAASDCDSTVEGEGVPGSVRRFQDTNCLLSSSLPGGRAGHGHECERRPGPSTNYPTDPCEDAIGACCGLWENGSKRTFLFGRGALPEAQQGSSTTILRPKPGIAHPRVGGISRLRRFVVYLIRLLSQNGRDIRETSRLGDAPCESGKIETIDAGSAVLGLSRGRKSAEDPRRARSASRGSGAAMFVISSCCTRLSQRRSHYSHPLTRFDRICHTRPPPGYDGQSVWTR